MSSEVLCHVVPRNYCGGINVVSGSINYLKRKMANWQRPSFRRLGAQQYFGAIDSYQAILMSLFRAISSAEPM